MRFSFVGSKIIADTLLPLVGCRIFLVVLLALAGCDEIIVARGISQKQALKIVAVLAESGVHARGETERGANASVVIKVAASEYVEAAQILAENNLPEVEEATIAELLQGSSFLPQSRMVEALKLDRAKSLELQEYFKGLPGLVDVRVLLTSNPHSVGQRGVSLIVVRKPNNSQINEELLRRQLRINFPDLAPEDLVVSVVDADSEASTARSSVAGKVGLVAPETVTFLWVWRVRPEHWPEAAAMVVLLFLAAGIVGAAVGWWYANLSKSRVRSEASAKARSTPLPANVVKASLAAPSKSEGSGWN